MKVKYWTFEKIGFVICQYQCKINIPGGAWLLRGAESTRDFIAPLQTREPQATRKALMAVTPPVSRTEVPRHPRNDLQAQRGG